jgi:hypothetical protein
MNLGRKRKVPPGDPWRQALDRHIAGEPTEPSPRADAPAPRGRRRLFVGLLAGGAALIVALLAAGGYLGYVAMENGDRADDWRDRSSALQGLVGDRTKALNRQTARLNVASTRLRQARRAVTRSEQDAEQLAARQRELAAEKAEVEDQRAALEVDRQALIGVANQIGYCNQALVGLIQTVDSGFQPSTSEVQGAATACAAADEAIDSYNANSVQ